MFGRIVITLIFIAALQSAYMCAELLKIQFTDVSVENSGGNDCFGEWTGRAENGAVYLGIEILKEPPDDITVTLAANVAGADIPEYTCTLCDALSNDVLSEDLLEAGTPEGSFSTNCPIQPGSYGLENFIMAKSKLLDGMVPGQVTASISIGPAGENPWTIIHIQGEIIRKAGLF